MTKVTNEHALQFRRNFEVYTKAHSAQFRPFLYALNKMYAKTKFVESEFAEKERELEVKYCSKDKDGYAIEEKYTNKIKGLNGEVREEEARRFKYTPENMIAAGKEKREWLDQEVDIEPHSAVNDIPEDIDFNWWRVFSPFVLPPLEEIPEDKLEELYKRTQR